MKSPWKFITGIFSRRRPDGEPASDALKAPGTDLEGEQRKEQAPSLPPANRSELSEHDVRDNRNVTAPATTSEGSSKIAVSQANASAETAIEAPAADAAGHREKSDAQEFSQVRRRTGTTSSRAGKSRVGAKIIRSDAVSDVSIIAAEPDQTDRPAPSSQIIDEMTRLDVEIGHLRTQLAQKLSLQNAQLKEMLERFDKIGRLPLNGPK
jgi:hypothetical protein